MATLTPPVSARVGGASGRRAWVRRHPVAAFLVLCFGLTWAGLLPLAADSRGWLPVHIPLWLLLLAIVGPGVAAFGVAAGSGGNGELLARITRWRFGVGWYVVAILGPAGLCATALSLDRLSGGPPLDPPSLTTVLPGAVLILGVSVISEEIGWRGFLLPHLLERCSPLDASLVLGIIWTVWHLPYLLWIGHPLANMPLPAFTVFGLASSVGLTCLYLRSRSSALPALLLQFANISCQLLLFVAPGVPRPFERYAGLYALFAVVLVFSHQLSTREMEPDSGRAGK
jgi:CAAX protease family protein